jgi:hypothetical protein
MSNEIALPAVSCAARIVAACPWFALIVPVRSAAGEGDRDGDVGVGDLLPHPLIVMLTPARIASAASSVNSPPVREFSFDIRSSIRRRTVR